LIHIVWLKKDFRLTDHEPLVNAAAAGRVLLLWLQEPTLHAQADVSERHLHIERLCVQGLAADVSALGGILWTAALDAVNALHALHQWSAAHGGMALYSHEETGNNASYARDIAVGQWCRENGIEWQELPRNAVVRRLKNRNDWGKHWGKRMSLAPYDVPNMIFCKGKPPPPFAEVAVLPESLHTTHYLRHTAKGTAGRLDYFLMNELRNYRRGMSSPVTAPQHCSRLSTQLAMGVVSIRQVIDAIWMRRLLLEGSPSMKGYLDGLKSFEGRLHWHCHFVQKLEDEPRIEFVNMHRGYDGLREHDFNEAYFQAWANGMTGVPMVDACMRRLNATGWINFRMRAMLMSFAAYHLWLHWREPALHLARQFCDYEPGIHYPQIQMQSGTTGINAARIYNPVKQALDQDEHGTFIRQWCPELTNVPLDYLAQPWLLTPALQVQYGCVLGVDYPVAIVNVEQAGREAKERFHAWRKKRGMDTTAKAVFEKHGSRRTARSKVKTARSADKPTLAHQTLSLFA
jgi:deoxyribodipyrimidine photo-lyase